VIATVALACVPLLAATRAGAVSPTTTRAPATTAATSTSAPTPVSAADVGAPSWWNGDCDASSWNATAAQMGWSGAGAHRLGASYLGVPVCGPRPGEGAPNVAWSKPGWGELEWQCPELAFRFMAQLYGVNAYGANGGDVVRNYSPAAGGGLVKIDNGTVGTPPLPGDVISFDNGFAGHVGVVASSTVDVDGNGSVTMLSQNDTADGWRTIPVTGWVVQPFGSYVPYGWLHDPLGRGNPAIAAPQAGRFHSLSPTRVLDSRDGTGSVQAPWGPGETRNLTVAGVGGVPADATAVTLNVTVTDTSAGSFLTVFPAGQGWPLASNLNWPAGDTRPNLVVAKIGAGGAVSIFNYAGSVDVVADVQGWFDDGSDPTADALVAVSPVRVLDSRDGTGGYTTPWGPGTTRALSVAGVAGVPAGVDAVMLNVTVTDTSTGSFLTVFPAGQGWPLASNLNWPAGDTRPNLVVAKIGAGGAVSIFNYAGSVHVVADVVGYLDTGASAPLFTAISPARVLDSRDGTGGYWTPWGAGSTRSVLVTGALNVPGDATGVVVNVTVTNPTAASFVTAFPNGVALPWASNLNFGPGQTVPNLALVPVGSGGRIALYNLQSTVDIVVDVVGYTR
jgi:hypothetical protein